MNCEKCRWYKFPLLIDGKLHTPQAPTVIVITDTRRCELGGCNGGRYEEEQNDRLNRPR